VAVVVAEALGGSHPQFVDLMNATAARLGMTRTTFHNAHGLPHPQQTTTARDMAILAKALFDDYPDDYARFATLTFSFRGRSINSHNNFLRGFPGAQGLKTGFTCKAGFNLVATASRETRHLVGVVLGDATAAARDARMVRLMRAGFAGHRKLLFNIDSFPATPAQGSGALINTQMIAEECINPQHGRSHTVVSEWGIQLGVEATREAALDRARGFIKRHRALLKGGRPLLTPRWVQNVIYEVGITDLKKADATNTCLTVRNDTVYCVARPPEAQQYAMDKALRVLAAVAKREAARHCTSGPCAAATDSARDQ
jgi:hypothetical protein